MTHGIPSKPLNPAPPLEDAKNSDIAYLMQQIKELRLQIKSLEGQVEYWKLKAEASGDLA